jgi:hypothetical protein
MLVILWWLWGPWLYGYETIPSQLRRMLSPVCRCRKVCLLYIRRWLCSRSHCLSLCWIPSTPVITVILMRFLKVVGVCQELLLLVCNWVQIRLFNGGRLLKAILNRNGIRSGGRSGLAKIVPSLIVLLSLGGCWCFNCWCNSLSFNHFPRRLDLSIGGMVQWGLIGLVWMQRDSLMTNSWGYLQACFGSFAHCIACIHGATNRMSIGLK